MAEPMGNRSHFLPKPILSIHVEKRVPIDPYVVNGVSFMGGRIK